MPEFREVESPYPGLRPFESHEAGIFFGRERHTDRLLEILQRERFLVVIGPSGSGKSSLVRAGLLPCLTMGSLGSGSAWRIALLRPGDQPIRSLARALLQPDVFGRDLVAPARFDDATNVALLTAELRRGPLGLLHATAAARERSDAAERSFNLLVLVDQFEELFTYAEASGERADESEAFVNLMLAARAEPTARVYVALTMRTDFLGNCVRFAELPEAINYAQYLTPRLTPAQMTLAIRGPAEVFGGSVEPTLVAELINTTGQNSDQLPLLQHALARMWTRAVERDATAPRIGWDDASAIGGLAGALNQHAEKVLEGLLGKIGTTRAPLVEAMFCAITERRSGAAGGQDVRRPQTMARIAHACGLGDDWQPLAPIVTAYAAPEVCQLQCGRALGADSVIDLSHEALMRQWKRLSGWVADESRRGNDYRRWAERATEHAQGNSDLLEGAALARAVEWRGGDRFEGVWQPTPQWAERYTLSEDAQAEFAQTIGFIADSAAQAQRRIDEARERSEQERRDAEERAVTAEQAARQFRGLSRTLATFGSMILVVMAAAIWFYNQRSLAVDAQLSIAELDLSVSYNKLGDSAVAQGKLDDAARAYRDGLAIAKKLAAGDPGNTQWQSDLSVSYIKLGDVAVAQGRLAEAERTYGDSLAIRNQLVAGEPGNTEWQRELSVSYSRVGDVAVAQGRLDDAARAYGDDMTIAKKLAAGDPGNTQWQRDLSVSFEKLGDVAVAQGRLDEAARTYGDGLTIRKKLAAGDPGNTAWQRDLATSLFKISELQAKQKQWPVAIANAEAAFKIDERLSQLDRSNVTWQEDVKASRAWLEQLRRQAASTH